MEATLLHFVLHITTSFGSGIAKDLRKDEFQGIVPHSTTRILSRRADGVITIIRNIESGAKTMAALFRCITVDAAQTCDIFLSPEYAGNNNRVQGNLFHSQRIQKSPTDMLKKTARAWY